MQQDVAIPPLWQLKNEGMVLHCWRVEEYWSQSEEIFLAQLRQCCVDAGSVLAVKKDQSIHFNK